MRVVVCFVIGELLLLLLFRPSVLCALYVTLTKVYEKSTQFFVSLMFFFCHFFYSSSSSMLLPPHPCPPQQLFQQTGYSLEAVPEIKEYLMHIKETNMNEEQGTLFTLVVAVV